jgi:IS5 family transposase
MNSKNPGHVVKFNFDHNKKIKDYHMYTGLKQQLDLSDDLIRNILPQHHDLIKLKDIINWKKINKIYKSCYPSNKGRSTKRADLVIGLLLLKFLYQKSDRALIEELEVNNAFMYFCSVSHEDILLLQQKNIERKKPYRLIDHSTLVKVRKKLTAKRIQKIEKQFTDELKKNNIIDGKQLFIDTTSLEKNILYPTEVSLLKRVIEHGEMIVQQVSKKKDLIKSNILKKANQICKVYYSTGRKTKELLINTSKQLVALAENILVNAQTTMESVSEKAQKELQKTYDTLTNVGNKIVNQTKKKLNGEKVKDKIVSYHEAHARSLPKGKVHRSCEFGSKLEINMSGNGYITRHKLHQGNPADVELLADAIGEHDKNFKDSFEEGAADRGFYDSELIELLENVYNIRLAIPHKKDRNKPLDTEKKKLYDKRAAIEAKISEGKRCYGLDKSLFKGKQGSQVIVTSEESHGI